MRALTHTGDPRIIGPKIPWPQADHQLLMSICCWWWQCDTWHDWAKGSLVSWGKALLHRTSGAHALMHSGALSCVHPSTLSQGTVRPSTLTGLDSSQNALSYPKTCAPCTGSQRDFSCNFCSIWWLFLWQNWIFWKLWFLRNRVISEHAKGIYGDDDGAVWKPVKIKEKQGKYLLLKKESPSLNWAKRCPMWKRIKWESCLWEYISGQKEVRGPEKRKAKSSIEN